MTILLVLILVFGLAFEYINGFHDTANAIATVVSTRVLTPFWAIMMAACLNVAGALVATKVASTIAKGLVPASGIVDPHITSLMVLAAVLGAISWNLLTWYYGIPSSSSHALVGSLIGAAMAIGGTSNVLWHGLTDKVLIPIVASPVIGFFVALLLMRAIVLLCGRMKPEVASNAFRKLQLVSSSLMAYSHGQNDAQKTMGIVTMALFSNHMIDKAEVPLWVKLACAITMGLGTAGGGWRIMKTLGHRIIRLEPVNGFAAETAGAAVILAASSFGMQISTTHAITACIFGVGAAQRRSAVRWSVAQSMVIAWVLTIPATAVVGALVFKVLFMLVH